MKASYLQEVLGILDECDRQERERMERQKIPWVLVVIVLALNAIIGAAVPLLLGNIFL